MLGRTRIILIELRFIVGGIIGIDINTMDDANKVCFWHRYGYISRGEPPYMFQYV